MRRLITWTILLPVIVAVVVFALNNRQPMALDLWPFAIMLELPVYLAILLALVAGIFFGGVASWLVGAKVRGRYREKAYEAQVLSRELAEEKQKTERLQQAAQPAPVKPYGVSGPGSSPAEILPPH